MNYTADTPLQGPSAGTPADWHAIALDHDAIRMEDVDLYVKEVYRLSVACGFRAEVILAQGAHETAFWTSEAWSVCNPAGIGVTNDSERRKYDFGNGTTAARVHLVHLALYATGTTLPAILVPYQSLDPRWDAAIRAGYAGVAKVLSDLNGRWAWPGTTYGQKIASLLTTLAPRFTTPSLPPEATIMASTVTWPGLPGGPISFTFPFSVDYIVPAWRTLNRPGIKARRPRKPIQHENGNQNAYARQDTIYLRDGAGGRQASWHATVDHMEGFANLPADEIGWHAGDGAGDGNYAGFAIELSQRSMVAGAVQWRQARRNAAEVMGRIMARLDGDTNWGQHAWYMLKNCPQYLRGNATHWAEYKADCTTFYNDERSRIAGGVMTAPTGGLAIGVHVQVIADNLNIRTGSGTAYPVISTLVSGRKGVIKDGPRVADGYTWWDIQVDGFGTGWVAGGLPGEPWLEAIAAPAPPPPAPTYAPKSPVPALLETNLTTADMYNTAVAVRTVAETDFIFVADVIEFKRTSNAQQYAGEGGRNVAAPYQEGDRAVAAWITKIADGTYWYLLAGGDDEWVRVKVTDTVRIADAPLLGDATH